MYIIYKSWHDSLTSMHEPDKGYDVVGYVETEEEAIDVVNSGGIDNRPLTPQKMYKYELVEPFIADA